jgi:tetratricopeptide (TPR) repeat protein
MATGGPPVYRALHTAQTRRIMLPPRALWRTAVLAAFAPSLLAAQGEHQHGGAPPAKLGHVTFKTSCSPEGQRNFERGVALIHSFWYEEAGKAFRAAAKADSACGMAHWGSAMSLLHPLWTAPPQTDGQTGLAEAELAVHLTSAGGRERAYAEAIATFYRGYDPSKFRPQLEAYQAAMETVAQRFPKDPEAQIFNALALIAVGQLDVADTAYARQRRAAAILEPLFKRAPSHPGLAHYLIHAYDYPVLAKDGVQAAERYASIAPAVPHAQHMPSHIYTRIGAWDSSVSSNRRSAESGHSFEQQQHLAALWDQHAHALDYLAYAYLQQGRDREAKGVLDQAASTKATYPANSLTSDYALAAIPARYFLERGEWAKAKTLPLRPAPAWRGAEALTHFARALGAARSADVTVARAEVDTLASLEKELANTPAQSSWSTQARIQRLAASAWVFRLQGDTGQAIEAARTAADIEDITPKHPVTPGSLLPARELYGDLLLEIGRAADARRAYEASLYRQPNRARSLYGAARAAELAGDRVGARQRYQELDKLLSRGDGDRPELALARKALASR